MRTRPSPAKDERILGCKDEPPAISLSHCRLSRYPLKLGAILLFCSPCFVAHRYPFEFNVDPKVFFLSQFPPKSMEPTSLALALIPLTNPLSIHWLRDGHLLSFASSFDGITNPGNKLFLKNHSHSCNFYRFDFVVRVSEHFP